VVCSASCSRVSPKGAHLKIHAEEASAWGHPWCPVWVRRPISRATWESLKISQLTWPSLSCRQISKKSKGRAAKCTKLWPTRTRRAEKLRTCFLLLHGGLLTRTGTTRIWITIWDQAAPQNSIIPTWICLWRLTRRSQCRFMTSRYWTRAWVLPWIIWPLLAVDMVVK